MKKKRLLLVLLATGLGIISLAAGGYHLMQKQSDAAKSGLATTAAAEDKKRSPQIRELEGRIMALQKQITEHTTHSMDASRLIDMYMQLSQFQSREGAYKEAEESLEKARKLWPKSIYFKPELDENVAILREKVICKMLQKDYTGADTIFKDLNRREQKTIMAPYKPSNELGTELYIDLHMFEKAKTCFDRLADGAQGNYAAIVRLVQATQYYSKLALEQNFKDDSEKIAALSLLNSMSLFLKNKNPQLCKQVLEGELNLLSNIAPGAPDYRSIAAKTYLISAEFQEKCMEDPKTARVYKQKAEELSHGTQ